jgi:hypothetical protein
MALKPQDVYVVLKLVADGARSLALAATLATKSL